MYHKTIRSPGFYLLLFICQNVCVFFSNLKSPLDSICIAVDGNTLICLAMAWKRNRSLCQLFFT